MLIKRSRQYLIETFLRSDTPTLNAQLNDSQWYSKDELDRLQLGKLKALLRHAYDNSLFYRNKFDQAGFRPEQITRLDDLCKAPPLSKEELRNNFDAITVRQEGKRYSLTHSSGTMGKPLMVLRDRYADSFCQSIRNRCYGWHGFGYYDKQVRVWGLPLTRRAAMQKEALDFLLGRKRLSPFQISPKTVPGIVAQIEKYNPTFMYGWLSGVYDLSRTMLDLGLTMKLKDFKGAVTTSETLFNHQRSIIEKAIGRVINEYGCSESGILAFECPAGGMHVMSESVLLEFVNNGQPAEAGEPAEILLTDLKNLTTPLIRYQVGDLGRYLTQRCACGRELPLVELKDGRVLDTVVAADGALVHGGLFCYAGFEIISRYGAIRDFRIVQRKDTSIDMTISKDKGYNERVLEDLTKLFRDHLGPIEIRYHFVDDIPTGLGKQKFVISELTTTHLAQR